MKVFRLFYWTKINQVGIRILDFFVVYINIINTYYYRKHSDTGHHEYRTPIRARGLPRYFGTESIASRYGVVSIL